MALASSDGVYEPKEANKKWQIDLVVTGCPYADFRVAEVQFTDEPKRWMSLTAPP
jgi:hypothetical protein